MQSVQHPSAKTARRNTPTVIVAEPFADWRSELQVDVVGLLARRSGVDPATVAAQLSAWSFGGSR